jgi:hypothetical protein
MTRWTSVDQPTTQTERRRGEYAPFRPRKPDRIDMAVIVTLCMPVVLLAAILAFLTGCVTTELQTGSVTMTRTSVLSDVEVEATMAADGSITVRERQGQAVAEGLVGAVPGVTP